MSLYRLYRLYKLVEGYNLVRIVQPFVQYCNGLVCRCGVQVQVAATYFFLVVWQAPCATISQPPQAEHPQQWRLG